MKIHILLGLFGLVSLAAFIVPGVPFLRNFAGKILGPIISTCALIFLLIAYMGSQIKYLKKASELEEEGQM